MKKMSNWFATTLISAALMGLGALPTFAADIYEIRPFLKNTDPLAPLHEYVPSVDTLERANVPYTTAGNPLEAGKQLFFNVRLVARTDDVPRGRPAGRFQLDYVGSGSRETEWAVNPPMIGIFVGDTLKYARMVQAPTIMPYNYYDTSYGDTLYLYDMVFKYTVEPGDLGLPIRLALRNGTPVTSDYDDPTASAPVTEYMMKNVGMYVSSDPWRINYYAEGSTEPSADKVEFSFAPSRQEPFYKKKDGTSETENPAQKYCLFSNFSLSECGFYAQTVDFDRDGVRNPGWKEVRQGRTNQTSIEIIDGEMFATNAVPETTLYVWAVSPEWLTSGEKPVVTAWDPEPAVEVVGKDETITIGKDDTGTAIWRPVKMATVTIKEHTLYANFSIKGLKKDKRSTLIMSSSKDFHYNSGTGYQLDRDFITCEVSCVEGKPELWLKLTEPTDIYTVTSDYTSTLTTMKLTLTDAYTEEINVTIEPKLKEPWAGHKWSDVVHISDSTDPRTGWKPAVPLVVTIPKGSTASLPVYLYGMGATADQNLWTSGLGQEVDFTLTPDKGETFITAKVIDNLYVRPALPVIANAAEIAEITVPSGEPEPVSFAMSDNYTDMADKTTGYTIKALWWDDGEEPTDLKFRQNAFNLTTAKSGISTFKPDANGVLTALTDGTMIVDDLPVIPSDVRGQNLRIRITAPNTAQTAYHDIRVTVVTKPKAEASAYETKSGDYKPDSFPEVDEASEATMAYIGVDLESPNTSGGELYAFLKLKDETQADLVSGRCIVGSQPSQGIRIRAKESKELARGELKLQDGIQDGTLLEFDVVLCTTKSYDETKIYPKFDTSTPLEILVDNVKPKVKNISMSGWYLDETGKAFEGPATKDLDQYFTFDIGDAVRDLEATGGEAFALTYSFKGCSPKYAKSVTYKGNPADLVVTNKFGATGTCTLSVTLLDKDGGKTGPLSYTFEVTDKPYITIRNRDEITSFYEDESPEYQVTLSPSSSQRDENLTVLLTVTPQATGAKAGEIKLAGDFRQTGANTYIAVYEPGVTEHSFFVASADGTAGGASKFSFKAEVTTTEFVPGTETPWSEFYSKGILSPITVINAKPALTVDGRVCRAMRDTTGESDEIIYLNSSNAPIQVAIGEADPITWSADDVGNDLKAGITVTIVDQYGSKKYTVKTTEDQIFTPQFKYAGPTTVTFTGLDKDGGSIQAVRFYTIKATRQLNLTAVGPSDGNGSPHANYYRGAGRGQGHVYADAKCTGAIAFSFDYNCGLAASVKATAQGYRVGDIDNGTLKKNGSMGDIPITQEGKLYPQGTDPYFTYAGNRDSFFYVWVRDVMDADGKFTSEIYGDVSPEVKMAASATFTMPTDVDKETGAYPLSQYEAIFSKEFLWTDNIGDINADAIPDIYAMGYKGFGVSGEDKTDMNNLAQYNDDEDYFPFVFSDNQGASVFLTSADWVANSKKFTARLEIRGWGDHLNNAYQVLAAQGYAGSIPEYVATNVYTNPAVDTNSTLTAVEYDAWVQAGRDPNWSPERPTDPTVADTDGDNMPDGYEYYIWYKAHVGWIDDGGVHRYLTGRKYNPSNPYAPTEITSATIAAAFDPLSRAGSDWDTRDTDDDGLTDYAEYLLGTDPFNYDTDNDGLPDGYEVVFTETDPTKADSNNNGITDGAENPDNDSIAEISKDMFLVAAIGANGTEYYCCDGAKRDDFTLKPSETAHRGTVFMVGSVTLVTTRDWASSTYTNDNNEVCLRPGFNARNTWTCGDLEGKLVRVAEPTDDQLKTGTVVTSIQEDAEFYDQNLTSESTVVGTWYAAYPYQGGYARGGRADMEVVMRKPVMAPSFLGIKLMHYQVYQAKGFHSSTGWIHPTAGGVDTRSFTSMDEFLSMVFFHKTGSLSEADMAVTPEHSRIWIWQHYSTHPKNADTDGDMMPDGWEFYVMANTGDKGPTWHYSPLYDFRLIPDGQTQDNDGDLLTWPHEYSGTGSSSRYGWSPLKPTWRNKAEPTDPWDADTDEDGIKDGFEGGYGADGATIGKIVAMNFMYNTEGTSGGGLNPLSWDTDHDGLPDPWEVEFYGTYTPGSSTTVVTQETSVGDDGTTNTVTRAVTTTVGCTWNMDGMNATVDDAHVDYDHDGLANWQEYMVGTMRCWRYDDPESGWGVHRASADELEAILELGPGTAEWNEYWGERLVNKDGEKYNPNFANGYFDAGAAYFSCCRKPFDPANGNWYYFYDGIYHEQATDYTWSSKAILEFLGDQPYYQSAPKRYICCDPRNSDTDYDGMDDYYELFHGMNPMLGMPAVGDNGRQPCDIVYDAYNRSFLDPARENATGVSAINNWWRNDKKPHTTGMATGIKHADIGGYDFVAYPWLNGIASADPDGDNIVNQEEAIMPNVQAASTYHHTDPTPLWMTDSAYTNSLTRRYYRVSAPQGESSLTSWGWLFTEEPTFVWKGVTYKLSDFPGFTYKANTGALSFSYRLDTFFGSYAWYCSFEENEGYDSDHDYLSDYEEGQGKTKNASDPQSHDDPLRRQAMYFNGVDAFLETPVATREWDPDSPDSSTEANQNFLYYTVECWAKPDEASLKNDNTVRTLVERAIWADNASAADETLMRKNFLIGIKGGRWYTCFDSSGTDIQPVEISNGPVATTNWTHIAATFDGTALRLYVNGICNNSHATSIQPEHGVAALALNKAGEMNPTGGTIGQATDEHDESFIAILVGASAKTKNGIVFDSAWRYRNYLYASATNPEGLYTNATGTVGTILSDYHNFYKGYIDEVRIWDGARSAADIQSDVDNRVRYTADLAIENRQAVYNNWKIGGLRSPASDVQLPPQLMYHWSFDQIAGAISPEDVIKVPAGFDTDKTVLNAKARWSRPADYVERNWNSSAVRSTVYTDNAWVPWINNTVAHLPRFDLTTLDSIYWSEDYAGNVAASTYGYSNFQFPRNAEVYSRWTQRTYNGSSVFYCIFLDPDFNYLNGVDGVHGVSSAFSCALTDQRSRWDVVSGYGSVHLTPQTKDPAAIQTELALSFRFALRDRNTCGDDILPMGGAYPRRISSAEGGMWDNLASELPKASDAWAETGNDADNNGLPDWWEDYARKNYCQGLSPEIPLTWDTTVTYYGIKMPAYQAYLRDLASGMVKIGSTVQYDLAYADTRDNERDGLPDWWEEMYGLDTSVDNADADPDNDGLSNYQEYLLGEYYLTAFRDQFKEAGIDVSQVNLSPVLAFSSAGQIVPDYFLRYSDKHEEFKTGSQSHFFANEYFGEIATDHDFMEDWWENRYDISYTNSKKYDPSFDRDGDGWSTYAECRAALWGGYFAANFIDKWAIDDLSQYLACYPQPIIGVKATYYGKQDISGKPLVVRTTSGQTARTDATFVVPAEAQTQTRYIGAFAADTILHGHLSPGMIDPTTIQVQRALSGSDKQYHWNYSWYEENDDTSWAGMSWDGEGNVTSASGAWWQYESTVGTFAEYQAQKKRWPMIQLEDSDLAWETFVESVDSADGTRADLYIGSTWFGYVNCTTGEYELDMSKFSGDKPFDQYTFRVSYSGRIGNSWPQTVYLSDTRELSGGTGDGYVREGKNTIEAFIDIDGDGAYTPGEPYGVVQNVDVGWHKVPVTVIELKDVTHVVPRVNAVTLANDRAVIGGMGCTAGNGEEVSDSGAQTKTLSIRRVCINGTNVVNGVEMTVPKRTLATKTLVVDSRAYLTEADVLGNAKFDLDSRWLVRDAVDKLGLKRSEINNATYEISEVVKLADGTTTNTVLMTFVNTFNPQRTRPTAVAPLDKAPVYAGSPTFSFSSGDETMTAYRLQVAKADGTLVYDSGDGTQGNNLPLLPGRTPNTAGSAVYEVTPPIYADARVCSGMITNTVFADGQDYKWRVALYNAKFNDIESENDWSVWAEFQMDVGNNNRYPRQATGYGSASISVRYYGPTNATPDRIWVEAFENADFRGQPVARATLEDIARLSDYTDIAHRNALVSGLAPGTYYFRAFIDFNGNGQRDEWESWGYNNYVGKGMKALYNPKPYVVTAATSDWFASDSADFTVFIEDCDTDQNEYPDCLEASFYSSSTGTNATDSDGDGISDSDEETYSTNPQLPDTDNDGMPDGYEAKFADTDPTLSDADECVAGDVMAFAKCDAVLIAVTTNGTDRITYMLEKGQKAPKVGDDAAGLIVRTTYTYPICEDGIITEYYGVGTNLTLTAGTRVVTINEKGTVVLVHKQVYDEFGFNPKTCVTDADAVNTKEFTSLDKYLVVRYLEALGRANEAAVNKGNLWKDYTLKPYEIDNDRDGIADGWELYVGANPWSFDDRESDVDGDGVTLLWEYNDGSTLDPNNANTLYTDVGDWNVMFFELYTAESQLADYDNDGLSNWAEYLATQAGYGVFDVYDAYSTGNVLDYYVKTADGKYVGEAFDDVGTHLIADHDFMEDAWEDLWDPTYVFPYALYGNRYVYDANLDADENGWKNWSECRAYHWGCGFYSDIIDTFINGNNDSQMVCAPHPAIGLHVTYDGRLDSSWKSLIVRTYTAGSNFPDAIFQVNSMRAEDTEVQVTDEEDSSAIGMQNKQVLGVYNGMRVMRGFITPGLIVPSAAKFEMTSVSQELTYHWTCTECGGGGQSGSYIAYKTDMLLHGDREQSSDGRGVKLDKTTVGWTTFATAGTALDGRHGKVYLVQDNDLEAMKVEIGEIDYRTGEFSLDLEKLSTEYGYDFEGMAFQVVSSYNLGAYWPQTVWLSNAKKGYVKEGDNTIEAFLDLNGDGRYDIGEPYGVLKHVNIGWHKTPEMRIELNDGTYNGIPMFEIQSSDDTYDTEQSSKEQSQGIEEGWVRPATLNVESCKIDDGTSYGISSFTINPKDDGKGRLRIVRTGINGTTCGANRLVWSRDVDVTYGKVYTVADLIPNGQIDFDARYLVRDAVAGGILAESIRTVTYAVYWGEDSVVPLYTFTRTFDAAPSAPALSRTYEKSYYKVLTAQPELTWIGRDGYGAFAVQVSEDKDFGTILYAATNVLPHAGTDGIVFRPDLYVGEALKDNTTYYWRVAQLNAKFTENVWSEVASFTTAVDSTNADTGYGKVAVDVRYYGASSVPASKVVVGVFEQADFCNAPIARMRLTGDKPVSALTNETDRAFTTLVANVVFDGIAPGDYYVMAFVDANDNGVRDPYETWGYVNKLTTDEKDIWSPVTLSVVSTKRNTEVGLLVMEDTDVNQNMVPDSLEVVPNVDSDGDGLVDDDESVYETDRALWDTDSDDMPDGWERLFANTDPLICDAEDAAAGDVMAFAKVAARFVTVGGKTYALADGEKLPEIGDTLSNLPVYSTYLYPVWEGSARVEYRGIGTNLTLTTSEHVTAVNAEGTAVLVHDQVYGKYGFNPKTCVTDEDAVNTKAFTALDKYLLIRYLDAQGKIAYDTTLYASGEDYVNANNLWAQYSLKPVNRDNDVDGIQDGWELYTGLNPWSYDDARQQSAGGEGLTNLQEYDGGYCPTDPNNADTDGDNVNDKYAYQYHLKGGDAGLDNDGDGLSNYAEYLISEVFKFAMLDPDNPKTDGSCVDYFRKVGDLYFGEVFTDHDQVNDTWEQANNAFANRNVYDPSRDDDKDGWSNWAEAKAGTHPGAATVPGVDGEVLIESPVPTIAATVLYNGKKALSGNLVFQAWNARTDPTMQRLPEAAWVASATDGATNVTKYVGLNPGTETSFYLGTGVVSPGSLRVWFRDTAAENVAVYSNGYVAVSTQTNPQWYYFVADSQVDNYAGDLLLCVTNVAAVKVGSIDYSTGLVTIDFGSEALQQKVIDQWINGTDASGAAKSTGVASSAVQVDLKNSFVKLEWRPVNITIASGRATYYLSDCAGEPANKGRILEGSNKFTVFCDTNQDNQWSPGEPFGFVQDVGIGWQGGAFTVELTDVSPVFARVNLLAAVGELATDRQFLQPGASAVFDLVANEAQEPEKTYTTKLEEIGAIPIKDTLTADDGLTRVRVVRAFVDGDYKLGKTKDGKMDILVGKGTVLDKYLDLNTRSYLHEGDFLIDGEHDVGWFGLNDVLERTVYEGGNVKFIEGTNVTYMIVIGEGDVFDGSKGSNTVFRCLINKNYDVSGARKKGFSNVIRPRIDTTTPGIVYGAQPTFRWRMQNARGDDFDSYTAFEVQIRSGETVLYTSGVRDLPPTTRDANGVTYEWTLDRSLESVVGTSGKYTWRVAMYNAKFLTDWYRTVNVDLWSDNGSLVVNLNQQQPMNDHQYSSIAAAVKYAGPSAVLAKNPKVYLQAYATADFAGLPVGETFVTDFTELANTAHVVSNACVRGVFQIGTYYLKAFIDSNGNGVQDDFESWGGASEPVTIDVNTVTVPTVGLYIEDADTDGDWIPDAYEYALKGNLTAINGEVIGGDTIKFIGTAGSTGDAGVSTGLSGASLTIFQNGTYAKLVSGNLRTEVSINDIRAAVEKKVNPKTVRITALSLAPDGKTVTLSVAAEVTDSIAGQLLGRVYTDLVAETVKVTIKVYKKENLATAGWGEPVYTVDRSIGKSDVQVDVPVNGIDMTSGFYKIEIEQK